MQYHEKADLPHCVYWIWGGDELLYIGCARAPCQRVSAHGHVQPWHLEITKIDVRWFPDRLSARKAEAQDLIDNSTRYNRMYADPDMIGRPRKPRGKPRGDGWRCPKCGEQKKTRTAAYCPPCMTNYQAFRRLQKLAA
jgi:hypothetical protein